MKIIIGSDHAGFVLKRSLIDFLRVLEYEVIDKGPFTFDDKDDYPDYVSLVAHEVSKKPDETRGIVIGGSGQGEAIVANRFKDVRAVVYYGGPFRIVRLSREHNNANVISLGARFVPDIIAKEAVRIWIETPFSESPRHERRIGKIRALTAKLLRKK
ncbi:MAG: ribose-5-phosphate isomerase [Candidatus Yonathbacteria bacterium CG_4_10_14_3_um_filter_47_65]|uniref:Ribose-5-phosphate isomerase n=2 Tax=Parcubacteria group TaxID=1794811 RepID=A0A2M8D984_9BACT|nr:MAG: ribose-5-phosphate isomerase [Candidatus Nomurabacteria bacterium CG1_02_47_685]PIP03904.1 MAG: ribose-5-phosphate isomerase [Candidatus Yonathbacteria bacterium CG23_combo_of_CG06-09_8_20_14_all_46_18]PIQ31188.1 MAG: ribose-5-phosphate isomerase [Candidatus Yonathbacteria bacterium CG17_big_fil_post_rev_8_21_14_2_50_46_19]PIX56404.1 MAG: ribose-5-phosphate isomerase [Candidatus Yonathbacteria bacterium CG_4_10_14_3_um_filter_47_65]PIY58025.1 MAG: ribose-5-phosphate isomerase [Candidatu